MDLAIAQGFLDEVNAKTDPLKLIQRIGYAPDKVQVVGESIKAFCPIHKDKKFRSLLVEPGRAGFKCTLKTCPGSQGGTYVDLYAMAKQVTPVVAAAEIAGALDLGVDPAWNEKIAAAMLEEAEHAFVRQEPEQAEAAARLALQLQPNNVEARLMLASMHAQRGETLQAAEEYSALADNYLTNERFEEADSTLESAIKAFPESEDLVLLQVKSAELQGKPDKVIELLRGLVTKREQNERHIDNVGLLDQLIKLQPDEHEFHLKLADIHERRHDLRSGARELEKAIKLLKEQSRRAEVIPLLRRIIQVEPELAKFRISLAEELIAEGDFPGAKEQTFEVVNLQMEQQDYAAAAATVNRWLEIEPESIEAHDALARIYMDQERHAEAAVELRAAAQIARKDRAHEQALQYLFRVKFLIPDDVDVRREIISHLQGAGDGDKAGFELLDLAEVLYAAGDVEGGAKALQDAAAADKSLSLQRQVADALAAHGSAEGAETMLRRLLVHAEEAEDWSAAAATAQRLLAINRDDIELLANRCDWLWRSSDPAAAEATVAALPILVGAGRQDQALALLEQGAGQVAEYSEANFRLFEAALEAGSAPIAGAYYQAMINGLAEVDADAALACAHRMAELDPDHPTALSDSAVLYATLGRNSEAAEAYVEISDKLAAAGNVEGALNALEEAAAQVPRRLDVYRRRATLIAESHSPAEAAPLFEEYIAALQEMGDPEEAAAGYLAYLRWFPDDFAIQQEAADTLSALGRGGEAAERFAWLAEKARQAGDAATALTNQRRASELLPTSPTVREQYGRDLLATGEKADAAAEFLAAAQIYYEEEMLDEALAALREAMSANEALGEGADLALRVGRELGQPEALEWALRISARQLRLAGRTVEALERTREWLNISPESADAVRLLGDLEAENGDTDAALATYEKLAERLEREKQYVEALAVHAEMGQLRAPDMETLRRLATLAEKSGDADAKIDAQVQLGAALVRVGELNEARDIAKKLSSGKNRKAKAGHLWGKLAEAYGSQDDAAQAWLLAADSFSLSPDLHEDVFASLNSALAINPNLVDAHERLAAYHEQRGEHDFAFSHRVAILPTEAPTGRDKQWKAEFAKLQDLAGTSPSRLLELAERAVLANRNTEALLALEKAAVEAAAQSAPEAILEIADAHPDLTRRSPSLMTTRADALVELQRESDAVAWLKECAHAALTAGQPADAEEYANRCLKLDATDPEAMQALAKAYGTQNRTQRAVETYLQLANLLQTAGEAEQAAGALRELLKVDSENIPARQMLWHVLLEAKQEKQALEEMQQLADLLTAKNQYKDATVLLSRILDYQTNNEETLERLASLVYENEGFEKAAPYFRKLLALRTQTRLPREAAVEYERILKLTGVDVGLRIEYAQFLEQNDLHFEAKQQLLAIAQVHRDELNDADRAIEFFEQAANLQPGPSDARIYEEIAELNLGRGQTENGLRAIRKAAQQYAAAGETKRAIEVMERGLALEVDADRAEDWAVLSGVYTIAGNPKKAKDAFEKAFKAVQSAECALPEPGRIAVLESLLSAQPANVDCALALLPLLKPAEAGERAISLVSNLRESGRSAEAIRVLKFARTVAPKDFAVRRELIAAYEDAGETSKFQVELADFVRAAKANGDTELAAEGVKRLSDLPSTPDLLLLLAPLHALLEDEEGAIASYAKAAELLAESRQPADAAEVLREAAHLNPTLVPASTVAYLLREAGAAARPVAMELFESALVARTRTRSLVIGVALLETASGDEVNKILSTVFMRAGAGFLVPIAGGYCDWLLERERTAETLSVTTFITELAPNSPDVWWLASQLRRKCDDKQGSADAALVAARLYNEAGAVTEEESCYREALEDLPDDAATLETLAYFYEREKRAEEGVEVMRRLAEIARTNQDLQTESQWLKKAVDLSPHADELRFRFAEVLELQNRKDQAVTQYLDSAKRSARSGNAELARKAYEKVLSLEPDNESAMAFLLDVASRENDQPALTRYTMALAEMKAEGGAVTQAIQLLKNLQQHDPENVEALEKLAAMSLLAHDDEGFRIAATSLGQKLVKRGDYTAAISQYELLLEQDPKNTETLQVLMDCCAAEGLTEKGVQYASQILEIARDGGDPERVRQAASTILTYNEDNPEARRDLAEAYLALNRVTEAVTEWSRAGEEFQGKRANADALRCYRRIVQVAPSTLSAWRKVGDLSLSTGDADAARGAYSHLVEAFAESGEAEKAEAVIARLLQLDPDDAELHEQALGVYRRLSQREPAMREVLWLVRHHLTGNRSAEADRLVQIGMEIAPESIEIQQCQLEVIRRLGRTDELQSRLRTMADQSIKEAKLETAAELLEQMRDAEPARLDLRRELGDIRMKLDDVSEGVAEFSFIVRELLNRGETEEARETAEAIAKQYPSELEVRARFGEIFTQEGHADVGARHYAACADLAAKAEDPSANVHFLTLATEARPRWSDGLERLAAAHLANKDKAAAADAYGRLAGLLLENRKFKECAGVLGKQIELEPGNPEPRKRVVELYERSGDQAALVPALKDLAGLYVGAGQTDEAVEVYKKLVDVQEGDPDILQRYIELFAQVGNELEIVDEYIKLAEAYAKRGSMQEAMQTFEQVLAIDRKNPDLRERFATFLLNNRQKGRALTEMRKLADLYESRNEYDAAVDVLHAAMALDPRSADTCLALAAAQEHAGYSEEAQASYSRASNIVAGTTALNAIEVYERFLRKDGNNAEVRARLCDLLERAGKNEAAAEHARFLAELYSSRGELQKAQEADQKAAVLMPKSSDDLRAALAENAHDPSLQYLDYLRYADRLVEEGETDKALDIYRGARALNDDSPQVIQKCIDCLALIAPEAEAIPDYLTLAERYLQSGQPDLARKAYEHVARLDHLNTDARAGLADAIAAEKAKTSGAAQAQDDKKVLGRNQGDRKKRFALDELLQACQDAAHD